jgi:organic radical activating enzyme
MNVIRFYERGQDNPSSLIVQWNLGNTCNYSCTYCPTYLHRGNIPWPDLNLIKNTLLKIKEKFISNDITVEMLGGEITLYKEFIPLMKFLKENNFSSNILSNGSRTLRFWEEASPYLNNIGLTYHSEFNNEEHLLGVIKTLTENNVTPYIKIAMVKEHFWNLIKFQKKIQQEFPYINIEMVLLLDKMHQFKNNGYYYNYSREEIEYLIASEEGITGHLVAEYTDGLVESYTLNQVRDSGLNKFKGFECGSKLSLIIIDHKGNLSTSLCRQRPRISIHNIDTELDSLLTPVICELEKCVNHSDLRILKEKI